MWITWWPYAYAVTAGPATRAPSSAEELSSIARHPSVSRARLQWAVAGLPWRVLCESWESSAHALGMARTDSARQALVQLREVLLEEMATRRPRAFARWYAAQTTA